MKVVTTTSPTSPWAPDRRAGRTISSTSLRDDGLQSRSSYATRPRSAVRSLLDLERGSETSRAARGKRSPPTSLLQPAGGCRARRLLEQKLEEDGVRCSRGLQSAIAWTSISVGPPRRKDRAATAVRTNPYPRRREG